MFSKPTGRGRYSCRQQTPKRATSVFRIPVVMPPEMAQRLNTEATQRGFDSRSALIRHHMSLLIEEGEAPANE
jgi:metal-responsive CopG/Arc/MetJ family transcriptional regulator